MSDFLDTPENISAMWLTNRLRRSGHLPTGEVQSLTIAKLQKQHLTITVSYSNEASSLLPRNFILKWYGKNYPYGVREGEFYERVAVQMPHPPVPLCYDVLIDDSSCQTQLLLADLSSTHTPTTAIDAHQSKAILTPIIDVYADFHAYWWNHPLLSQVDFVRSDGIGVSHAATSTAAIFENRTFFSQKVAPQFMEQHQGKLPSAWKEICYHAIEAWAILFSARVEEGSALTLIHGDAHLNNVLFPKNSHTHAPILIDWEGWTRGIGVWDLARILTYCVHPSKRPFLDKSLLQRYHARLVGLGVDNYSFQECIEDFRLCILANIPHAMAWTGLTHLEYTLSAFDAWNCQTLVDTVAK
ncbi:MAG: aminoglycoside phosphotransferase family protein [Chloroflexi bacterium]|nr:aminoglycoside phosphotransferase family protein [Chloroflexota bacterium]